MWLYFRLFLLALRLIRRSRRDLVLENLVLRQQLLVHERPDRRPRLTVADRRFWSTVAQRWRAWRAHVLIVQPPTVVRWHRTAWRRSWARRSRLWGPKTPSGPVYQIGKPHDLIFVLHSYTSRSE